MPMNVFFTTHFVPGAVFLLLGLSFILFRKQIAFAAANWNMRLWHFAGKECHYRMAFSIVGVAFLVISFLIVLNIIQF